LLAPKSDSPYNVVRAKPKGTLRAQ